MLKEPVMIGNIPINTVEALRDLAGYYLKNSELREDNSGLIADLKRNNRWLDARLRDAERKNAELLNKVTKLTNRLHKKEFKLNERAKEIEALKQLTKTKISNAEDIDKKAENALERLYAEMNHIVLFGKSPKDSNTLSEVKKFLTSREQVGIKKYNTIVDRKDYSAEDWMQHMKEELADALLYVTALQNTLNLNKK